MGAELLKRTVRCGLAVGLLWFAGLTSGAERFAAVPRTANGQQAPVRVDPLLTLVNEAIRVNESRYLNVDVHTPWQIMHGILAYRREYQLKSGSEKISAVEYVSNGARFRGDYWFEKTVYGGRGHPYNGTPYHFEGHVNQFLAILTMCNLPLDHRFTVADGQVVTMQDMVNHAQLTASENGETTWTLWFLSRYLEPDATWTNQSGEPWSMERLVQSLTYGKYQNVLKAPCGGCHLLFALALARNAYIQKHGRLNGAWLQADQKLQQYIAAAQSVQNRDGSFSTKFFEQQEFSDDFVTRIKSSGHMLEWLMAALPERRLKEYWVRRGIETLCRDLINHSREGAEPGALYHAVHALVLYRERVAPAPATPMPEPQLAAEPPMPMPEPTRTAEAEATIRLQSLETALPPAPPLSDRKAELAAPVLIDEAHPAGADAPSGLFDEPPPLPPRDAKPLVIPNPIRLE